MRIGSLFSGVGMLEHGIERAFGGSAQTMWQVECEAECRRILQRQWPDAARYDDVRTVGVDNLAPVDLICGGFPCHDLSAAYTNGKRKGLDGERSGLWREFARIVGELRPPVVVIENVATWRDWLPVVRRDLWAFGYASLPLRLCASDIGAPHKRARVFVVAHADSDGQSARALNAQVAKLSTIARASRCDWGNAPARALGVADGHAAGVDRARLTMAGNAVVEPVAFLVGRVVRELIESEAA